MIRHTQSNSAMRHNKKGGIIMVTFNDIHFPQKMVDKWLENLKEVSPDAKIVSRTSNSITFDGCTEFDACMAMLTNPIWK